MNLAGDSYDAGLLQSNWSVSDYVQYFECVSVVSVYV